MLALYSDKIARDIGAGGTATASCAVCWWGGPGAYQMPGEKGSFSGWLWTGNPRQEGREHWAGLLPWCEGWGWWWWWCWALDRTGMGAWAWGMGGRAA